MWDADFGSPGWISLPQEDPDTSHSQKAHTFRLLCKPLALCSLPDHLHSHHQDDGRRGFQLCLISQDHPIFSTCLSLTFPQTLLEHTPPLISHQASSGTEMGACFSETLPMGQLIGHRLCAYYRRGIELGFLIWKSPHILEPTISWEPHSVQLGVPFPICM